MEWAEGVETTETTECPLTDAHPPCHLLQVVGIVEVSTSQKRNQHHARLELSKLMQDRNDIRFL